MFTRSAPREGCSTLPSQTVSAPVGKTLAVSCSVVPLRVLRLERLRTYMSAQRITEFGIGRSGQNFHTGGRVGKRRHRIRQLRVLVQSLARLLAEVPHHA